MIYDIGTKSISLPDQDSLNGKEHYTLSYSSQEADGAYYNVTVTGRNFVTHATKMRIFTTPSKTEFIILPALK